MTSAAVGVLAGPAAATPEADAEAGRAVVTDGEFLWRRDCASCHGMDGAGTRWGPTLQGRGAADVWLTLVTGRMPIEDLQPLEDGVYDARDLEITPREVEYADAEIDALVAHARAVIAGPDVPDPDVEGADLAHGAELFRLNCASCHVWNARGGALTSGHVATSLEGSSPAEVVAAMRVGLGTMPRFSEEVIDERGAADIAAYVRYLQEPQDSGGFPLAYIGPVAEGFAAWAIGIVGLLLIVRWIGRPTREDG